MPKPSLSRRNFLKINAALLAGSALAEVSRRFTLQPLTDTNKPNILIFVFDAMSARHLSLYGYSRKTTPNLEKFAERASTYHRHYSEGNFTTTGTASMLTGLHAWTHRAINYRGMIERSLADKNLFSLVGDDYVHLAFTQNFWADILLSQFEGSLDYHLPCDAFSQVIRSVLQPHQMHRDRALSYYAFEDFLDLGVQTLNPFPGSLLLASTELSINLKSQKEDLAFAEYPRGLPTTHIFSYKNEVVFQGINTAIRKLAARLLPYLGYFHLWSPHSPYNPRKDYIGIFQDDLNLSNKPLHPLANGAYSASDLGTYRQQYDEFIANMDAEFGRLMVELEQAGILQNSYVIVTADHGELFERGEYGHGSALMYTPVTHIPLLIRAPGQQKRADYHSLTSNLDLLPSLLQITGKQIPSVLEGKLLPGFGGTKEESRSLFPIMAKDNPTFRPLKQATFTLLKGSHELFFFTGYPDHADAFELYDLQEDPDELHDLFKEDITTAAQLKEELLDTIHTANRNFQKK
jgi:arylsulfatase A-like enzyme